MTMIKLENGNILNLSEIAYINAKECQAYFKRPVILFESDFTKEKLFSVKVTPADRDRIVEAMGGKPSGEYGEAIRWNVAGNPYEMDLDGKTYTLTEVEP